MAESQQRFTFRKNEILSGRKVMNELFAKGKIINVSPFRVVWMLAELSSPVQVAFSVPVKNFRQAVDRNRIKRQMREIYRKNKPVVSASEGKNQKQCALIIIYNGKKMLPFAEVADKLKLTLLRFEEEFKKNAG
jgi:ribonuclease P protein component